MFKFYKLGLKGKIWKIIDDCYINNESIVVVNGIIFEWFKIR